MGRWVWTVPIGACVACAVASGFEDAGTDASVATDATTDATKDAAVDSPGTHDASDGAVDTGPSVAVLQVNELNANITGSEDLIELYATSGGDTTGIDVEQNITTKLVLATLPTLTVATGDLIIVHLNAPAGVTTETTTKTDCSNAACYSGAWDVVGGTTGMTYTGEAILTRSADGGTILDGVAFVRTGVALPATYFDQVEALQDAGAWLPATCSGNPCSTNALATTISANWTGLGTTNATSVARSTNVDTNTAADWKVGSSSFGATNP